MNISHLDHLVLTVADIDSSCEFYSNVLGMEIQTFGNDRKSLHFGNQKINLHQKGKKIDPRAAYPTSGAADLCFIASSPIEDLFAVLIERGLPLEENGIVDRTGATGPIKSIYFRDPDGNLIEISNYHKPNLTG